MRNFIATCFMVLWAVSAAAHSPLKTTSPPQGAVLSKAPTEIILNFQGKIRLTRVTLSYAGQSSVDLDMSGHKSFASDFALPVTAVENGTYLIEWRGLGDDGHVMNGSFSFTIH